MKTATGLLALLALAVAGCVDYKVPINFASICAPPGDAQACAYAAACDAVFAGAFPTVKTLTPGGAVNDLVLALQIDNQMADNHNTESGQVNTHDAILESFDLSFEGQFPATKVTKIPANGRVPANGTTVIVFPVIPQASMAEIQAAMPAAIAAPLVVSIVARGKLLDGSAFETGEYRITVNVDNNACVLSTTCKPTDFVFFCPGNGCANSDAFKCVSP